MENSPITNTGEEPFLCGLLFFSDYFERIVEPFYNQQLQIDTYDDLVDHLQRYAPHLHLPDYDIFRSSFSAFESKRIFQFLLERLLPGFKLNNMMTDVPFALTLVEPQYPYLKSLKKSVLGDITNRRDAIFLLHIFQWLVEVFLNSSPELYNDSLARPINDSFMCGINMDISLSSYSAREQNFDLNREIEMFDRLVNYLSEHAPDIVLPERDRFFSSFSVSESKRIFQYFIDELLPGFKITDMERDVPLALSLQMYKYTTSLTKSVLGDMTNYRDGLFLLHIYVSLLDSHERQRKYREEAHYTSLPDLVKRPSDAPITVPRSFLLERDIDNLQDVSIVSGSFLSGIVPDNKYILEQEPAMMNGIARLYHSLFVQYLRTNAPDIILPDFERFCTSFSAAESLKVFEILAENIEPKFKITNMERDVPFILALNHYKYTCSLTKSVFGDITNSRDATFLLHIFDHLKWRCVLISNIAIEARERLLSGEYTPNPAHISGILQNNQYRREQEPRLNQERQTEMFNKLVEHLKEYTPHIPVPEADRFFTSFSAAESKQIFEFLIGRIKPGFKITDMETDVPFALALLNYSYVRSLTKSILTDITDRRDAVFVLDIFDWLSYKFDRKNRDRQEEYRNLYNTWPDLVKY